MTITGDVAQWLQELGLSCYEQNFREQGYELDSMKAMGLKDEDFAALQITKRGHINKINLSLAKQRALPLASVGFDRNGILNELIHFTRKELSSSGLNENNCWQLIGLTEKISEDITSLVWNYIDKNCSSAINSSQFLSVSEDTLIALLQRETIEIKEAELYLAISKWLNVNHASRRDKLFSLIRFGQFSAEELLVAEKTNVPGVQFLYPAWRRIADKRVCDLKNVPSHYFVPRVGQVQFIVKPVGGSAKDAVYSVKMSSHYCSSFPPATYEILTNDSVNVPGAATSYGANQWIQANFKAPVAVSKISVGASSQGAFADEGWDGSYVANAKIQYTTDKVNWVDIARVPDDVKLSGLTTIELPEPVVAKSFRLLKEEEGWLAVGALIFE